MAISSSSRRLARDDQGLTVGRDPGVRIQRPDLGCHVAGGTLLQGEGAGGGVGEGRRGGRQPQSQGGQRNNKQEPGGCGCRMTGHGYSIGGGSG